MSMNMIMIIITKKTQFSLYFQSLFVINRSMKAEKILNHNLDELAEANKNKFEQNEPFSHILLEDFFKKDFLQEILDEFPDLEKKNDSMEFNTKSDKKKFATNVEFEYPEKISNFLSFLNSFKFITFLQKLTGIKESLVPDPYFFGGGLHQIKRGGFLKVHADFNYHPQMKLDRRLNLLIYLNKEWKDEYGGFLELWDKNMKNCVKKLSPRFNNIVVFNTNDYSFHGHPDPLNCPENISRKSIALYYYSNGRPSKEINPNLRYHNTIYKNRNNSDDNLDERLPEFKKIFGKLYIRKKIKI